LYTRSSIHSFLHARQRNEVLCRIIPSRYSGDQQHDQRQHHDAEHHPVAHSAASDSVRPVRWIVPCAPGPVSHPRGT
jgi:hypothetical protein